MARNIGGDRLADLPDGQEEPLPPGEALGLETLREAITDTCGESATLETWREFFYRQHHGDSVEAKKKAFQRVRAALVKRGAIIISDDNYSLNSLTPKARHNRRYRDNHRDNHRDTTGTCPGNMSRQSFHGAGTGHTP